MSANRVRSRVREARAWPKPSAGNGGRQSAAGFERRGDGVSSVQSRLLAKAGPPRPRENLMSANHAREVEYAVEMAFEGDGRIRGMRAVIHADIGAYVRTAALVPAEFGAALLPGPYRVPAYACDLWSVVTNKTPVGTLRSLGRPECNLARERLMDLASARLALDPAEIRRRNLIRPDEMPYDCGTTSFGVSTVYDSGDFPALFDELLRRLDYRAARAEQAAVNGRQTSWRRGIGLAAYVEKTGLGPFETTRIEASDDGT